MKYPVSWPTTANRSWPRASISATRSPARVPVSYPSWKRGRKVRLSCSREYTSLRNRRGGVCDAREAIGPGRWRAHLSGSRGTGLLLRLPRLPPQRIVPRRGLHRPLLLGQRSSERPPEPDGDGVAFANLRGGLRRGGQSAGGLRPALEGGAGHRFGGAALRQEYAAAVSGAPDPPRAGADGLRTKPGLRAPDGLLPESQGQGRFGHHLRPGEGRGQGHVQPAG